MLRFAETAKFEFFFLLLIFKKNVSAYRVE
jgi:hypothetical protein